MRRITALLMALVIAAVCVPALAGRTDFGGTVPPGGGTTIPSFGNPVSRPVFLNPDSDYDGIPDYADGNSKSNYFSTTMHHFETALDVDDTYDGSYTFDYSWFMDDPTVFNYDLCLLSSRIASLAYHVSPSDSETDSDRTFTVSNTLGTDMSIIDFMQAHGMVTSEYHLRDLYCDNHITLIDVGIHRMYYGGEWHEVVLVAIRGTNSSWDEWNSNFEIGHTLESCDDEVLPFSYGENADWTDPCEHMGFGVAATRVKAIVEQFVAQNAEKPNDAIYWTTGHSRGASIANIYAKKLTDEGKTAFAYTFACPNTTTSSDASDYTTIFNIVNEDDLVAYLPFTEWGFTRYGRTAVVDMTSSMKTQFQSMIGESYSNDESTLSSALEKLSAIIDDRNDAYRYTCRCHGDGSDDSIRTDNWYFTASNRAKAILNTPSVLEAYYKLELEDATFYWTYHCQLPIFFVQMIGAYMSGEMSTTAFANYDIADKYESAKWALAYSALWGVNHPHYLESYMVIASTLTASSFGG